MLVPFVEVFQIVLQFVGWLIIASVIASWLVAFGVVNMRNNAVYTIVSMLNRATEPLLRPIRRIIPPLGGLDLSPMIALLLIYLVQRELTIAVYSL